MQKIIDKLLLSCLKASELIEKKLEVKLSFSEKIQLKVHKLICKACDNYEKQSDLLDQHLHDLNHPHEIDLSGLKMDIKDKLHKL